MIFGSFIFISFERSDTGIESLELVRVALEKKEEGPLEVEEHAEGLETGVGL